MRSLVLTGMVPLDLALREPDVLLPVLDDGKHCWVSTGNHVKMPA